MAYQTFIPTIWNEKLQRELEPKLIFAKHTNREYEGDVAKAGDSVRILNVGRPKTTRTTTDAKGTLHTNLPAPEEVDNSSITMPIKQVSYYNYYVGDIDQVQMKNDGKVMAAYQEETATSLAQDVDLYIGQTVLPTAPIFTNEYSDATHKYTKVITGESVATSGSEAQNVLELLDDIIEKARKNNIPDSETIYVSVTPKFEKLVRRALIAIRTDNSSVVVGKKAMEYYNLVIEWSNNVKTTTVNSKACEYVTARTAKAIAYVHPHTKAEPYRPEKGFADAIKGFILFDAMITRPDEIFNVLVTY